MRQKKGKQKYIKRCLVFFMASFLLINSNIVVSAQAPYVSLSTSWVDKTSGYYQELYGDNAIIGDENVKEDTGISSVIDKASTNRNILEELLASLIAGLGYGVNGLFESGIVDLSIDGIVYGRMNDSVMYIDLVHFGLENNNPYGIFAASVYYFLRKISFTLIPIIILVLLIKQLFHNTQKGRAQLKEVVEDSLFFFLLVYAAPYLVELFIYFRDVCMYVTGNGLRSVVDGLFVGSSDLSGVVGSMGSGSTDGIFNIVWRSYESSGSLVDSILVLATSLAGIFYLADYVKIAALIAITFGFLPLILILHFFKPKIVTEWANIVLPNLFVPFVDMLLLMLPSVISTVYTNVFGADVYLASGRSADFILGVIMLFCIWSARVIRDRIIRLLGFEGLPKTNGMGMFAAMAMRMATAGKGIGRTGGMGNSLGNGVEELEKAAQQQAAIGAVVSSADSRISSMKMPEAEAGLRTVPYENKTNEFLEELNKTSLDLEKGSFSSMENHAGPSGEEGLSSYGLTQEADMDGTEKTEGVMEEGFSVDKVDRNVPSMPDSEILEECAAVADRSMESQEESVIRRGMESDSTIETQDMSARGGFMEEETGALQDTAEVDLPKTSDRANAYTSSVGEMSRIHRVSVPHPVLDDSFMKNAGISDRDKKRYANLAKMDALESKISKNNKIMTEARYDRASFSDTYQNESKRNQEFAYHENRLSEQRNNILDKQSVQYTVVDNQYQKIMAAKGESDMRLEQLESAYIADKENDFYNRHKEHCQAVEIQYANNSVLGGMNGKVYQDADSFKYAKQVESIKKQQANFKNFDTHQYDGILSPQEREEFYRERAMQQSVKPLVNVAGVAGGLAVGLVAGGAMAYGGPMTSAMAAIGGAGVTNRSINKTIEHIPMDIGSNERKTGVRRMDGRNPASEPSVHNANATYTVMDRYSEVADRKEAKIKRQAETMMNKHQG